MTRPVTSTASPSAVGTRRKAARSRVAAASPSAVHVQRFAPSVMSSRPRHAAAPIRISSRISNDPCTLTPSSPFVASKGTQFDRTVCHVPAQETGRSNAAMEVASRDHLSVPASRTAISDSSTPPAAAPILASPANSASVRASWLASSRQKNSDMSSPMPIPNSRQRAKRAMANSAPRMVPVYDRARMLPAGAKNRNVIAGPSPAPLR